MFNSDCFSIVCSFLRQPEILSFSFCNKLLFSFYYEGLHPEVKECFLRYGCNQYCSKYSVVTRFSKYENYSFNELFLHGCVLDNYLLVHDLLKKNFIKIDLFKLGLLFVVKTRRVRTFEVFVNSVDNIYDHLNFFYENVNYDTNFVDKTVGFIVESIVKNFNEKLLKKSFSRSEKSYFHYYLYHKILSHEKIIGKTKLRIITKSSNECLHCLLRNHQINIIISKNKNAMREKNNKLNKIFIKKPKLSEEIIEQIKAENEKEKKKINISMDYFDENEKKKEYICNNYLDEILNKIIRTNKIVYENLKDKKNVSSDSLITDKNSLQKCCENFCAIQEINGYKENNNIFSLDNVGNYIFNRENDNDRMDEDEKNPNRVRGIEHRCDIDDYFNYSEEETYSLYHRFDNENDEKDEKKPSLEINYDTGYENFEKFKSYYFCELLTNDDLLNLKYRIENKHEFEICDRCLIFTQTTEWNTILNCKIFYNDTFTAEPIYELLKKAFKGDYPEKSISISEERACFCSITNDELKKINKNNIFSTLEMLKRKLHIEEDRWDIFLKNYHKKIKNFKDIPFTKDDKLKILKYYIEEEIKTSSCLHINKFSHFNDVKIDNSDSFIEKILTVDNYELAYRRLVAMNKVVKFIDYPLEQSSNVTKKAMKLLDDSDMIGYRNKFIKFVINKELLKDNPEQCIYKFTYPRFCARHKIGNPEYSYELENLLSDLAELDDKTEYEDLKKILYFYGIDYCLEEGKISSIKNIMITDNFCDEHLVKACSYGLDFISKFLERVDRPITCKMIYSLKGRNISEKIIIKILLHKYSF